jgi:hypothetical protein
MAGDDEIEAALDRIAAGVYSGHDVALVRSVTRRGADRRTIQVGGYRVRLENGRNIHIGDRVYAGPDARAIRDVLEDIQGSGDDVPQGSLRSVGGLGTALNKCP